MNTYTKNQMIGLVLLASIISVVIGRSTKEGQQELQQEIDRLNQSATTLQLKNHNYSKLKVIDDESFKLCGEIVEAMGQGMVYAFKQDTSGMESTSLKMGQINDKMTLKVDERKKLLGELGY